MAVPGPGRRVRGGIRDRTVDATLIFIIAVLAISSFVQSVSGFGFALVAVAALPAMIDLREAVALIALFNLFVSSVTLLMHRQGLQWKRALPIVIGAGVTLPIGYYFLQEAPKDTILKVLGAVLVVLGIAEFVMARRGYLALPKWAVWPLGLFGGVLGGAFNTAGPPIVAYVYGQPWRKTEMVATLQAVFLALGLTRNALMGAAGEYTRSLFEMAAWSFVPAFFAIWLGRVVLEKIPREKLRLCVFVFLVAMGIGYLV